MCIWIKLEVESTPAPSTVLSVLTCWSLFLFRKQFFFFKKECLDAFCSCFYCSFNKIKKLQQNVVQDLTNIFSCWNVSVTQLYTFPYSIKRKSIAATPESPFQTDFIFKNESEGKLVINHQKVTMQWLQDTSVIKNPRFNLGNYSVLVTLVSYTAIMPLIQHQN